MSEAPSDGQELMIAMFDVLGFKQAFLRLGYSKLREIYEQVITIADRERGHMVLQGWGGGTALGVFSPDHSRFSDTFLLWHGWDRFFVSTFVRTCAYVICEALENGIPLRGAISFGVAEMDKVRGIYFGAPIIEAAETERAQTWVGASFGRSIATPPYNKGIPIEGLIQYKAHVKKGLEELVPGLVVDWPKFWREGKRLDAADVLRKLNVEPKFTEYYDRSIDFIHYSKENADWMNHIPKLQGDIDSEEPGHSKP